MSTTPWEPRQAPYAEVFEFLMFRIETYLQHPTEENLEVVERDMYGALTVSGAFDLDNFKDSPVPDLPAGSELG